MPGIHYTSATVLSMDTNGEPLVLIIRKAVEEAVGIPVQVDQQVDNTFVLTFPAVD